MNTIQLAPYFSDEARAIEFIEAQMWPNGPATDPREAGPSHDMEDRQCRPLNARPAV